jgi:hypothetical protein
MNLWNLNLTLLFIVLKHQIATVHKGSFLIKIGQISISSLVTRGNTSAVRHVRSLENTINIIIICTSVTSVFDTLKGSVSSTSVSLICWVWKYLRDVELKALQMTFKKSEMKLVLLCITSKSSTSSIHTSI